MLKSNKKKSSNGSRLVVVERESTPSYHIFIFRFHMDNDELLELYNSVLLTSKWILSSPHLFSTPVF